MQVQGHYGEDPRYTKGVPKRYTGPNQYRGVAYKKKAPKRDSKGLYPNAPEHYRRRSYRRRSHPKEAPEWYRKGSYKKEAPKLRRKKSYKGSYKKEAPKLRRKGSYKKEARKQYHKVPYTKEEPNHYRKVSHMKEHHQPYVPYSEEDNHMSYHMPYHMPYNKDDHMPYECVDTCGSGYILAHCGYWSGVSKPFAASLAECKDTCDSLQDGQGGLNCIAFSFGFVCSIYNAFHGIGTVVNDTDYVACIIAADHMPYRTTSTTSTTTIAECVDTCGSGFTFAHCGYWSGSFQQFDASLAKCKFYCDLKQPACIGFSFGDLGCSLYAAIGAVVSDTDYVACIFPL